MLDPHLIARRVADMPLLADLNDDERQELMVGARLVRFSPGEALMSQGAYPDGAYFLLTGQVQVLTKLPGGGETVIAELDPGSTLGELALIRGGRRTATVRALSAVDAVLVDREYFRAALAQLRPAALKALHRVALIQTERLGALHGRIRDTVTGENAAYEPVALPDSSDMPIRRGAPDGFPYADFLPILPCFAGFQPREIAAVANAGEVMNATRGTVLCHAGTEPEHCYIVVRGAIASGFIDSGRMHPLNVLGPGCFCAIGPAIENQPTSTCYLVRENTVFLALRRQRFLELYRRFDHTGLMLLQAVNEHQANMVSRANNHLTRLVGLGRLGRLLGDGKGVSV